MRLHQRRRVRALCAFGLFAVLAAPVAAQAQIVPVEVHVANDPEQWTPGQYAFAPYDDVSIFVTMSSQQHPGYAFAATCVLSLTATWQELARVRIDGVWVQPGQDVARSPSFTMSWPAASVTVTCAPDWAPEQAVSANLGPELWLGPGSAGYDPSYDYGQPAPPPYPQYPPPGYGPPAWGPPPYPQPAYTQPAPTVVVQPGTLVVREVVEPALVVDDPIATAYATVDLMLHFMSESISLSRQLNDY